MLHSNEMFSPFSIILSATLMLISLMIDIIWLQIAVSCVIIYYAFLS